MANGSPFSLLGDLNFFNQIGASSFFSVFCSQKLEKGYTISGLLFCFFCRLGWMICFYSNKILQIVSSSSLMQFEKGYSGGVAAATLPVPANYQRAQ